MLTDGNKENDDKENDDKENDDNTWKLVRANSSLCLGVKRNID